MSRFHQDTLTAGITIAVKTTMESKNQISKLARLFVNFKSHLTIFIIINLLIWSFWLITDGSNLNSWPLYISVGWAIILAIHFLIAYEVFQLKKKQP